VKKFLPEEQYNGVFLTLLAHIRFAVVAQMVEHQLPKLRVVGSIPIYRSGHENDKNFQFLPFSFS
jgi:hypothetical protein